MDRPLPAHLDATFAALADPTAARHPGAAAAGEAS